MTDDTRTAVGRKRESKARGCCAVTVGVSLLTACAVIAIYVANNRLPEETVPTPRLPVPNAYDDFVRAGKMAKQLPHQSPKDRSYPAFLKPPTLQELTAFHHNDVPVMTLFHKALAEPYLHPAVRSVNGLTILDNGRFREIARTLDGEAQYYKRIGQPGRAAQALLDGIEMSILLPRGGTLMDGLVASTCQSIDAKPFELLLPALSASELSQAALRLDRMATEQTSFADVVLEEDRMETAWFLEMLRDPKGFRSFEGVRSFVGVKEDSWPTWRQWRQIASFSLADKKAIMRQDHAYRLAVAAEARRPYTGPSRVPIPQNLWASTLQGDILSKMRLYFVIDDAVFALLQTEVALYRYHLAQGRYPDQLAQLVPTYLKTIPDDPLGGGAGKPLRYRALDGSKRFLLYSLGPDLRDDGGKPLPYPHTDGPGDIVAGSMWMRITPPPKR